MILQATARVDAHHLGVRYAATNDTGVDLFAQHFVECFPEPRPSPYLLHVLPHELVVFAGTLPDPPLVAAVHSGRPHAQLVAPGDTLDITLWLPLPLLESGKLDGPDPEAPHDPHWANSIRVVLHCQPRRPGLQVRAHEELGSYDAWGVPPVVLVARATVDEAFVVLRRREPFRRPPIEGLGLP